MTARFGVVICLALAACGAPHQNLPADVAAIPEVRRPAVEEFVLQIRHVRNVVPFQVAAGRDGAMWFTEEGAGAIGRIDAAGTISQYRLPAANAQPEGIAAGPGGALYFAENEGPNQYDTHVGRITTGGRITQWDDSDYMPEGVAAGSDGTMWYTQGCGGLAILSAGSLRRYNLPGVSGESTAIALGPDGAMWFSQDGTAKIGRVDAGGTLTSYPGPMYRSRFNDVASGVAVGADGNLWWTASENDEIWAMSVRGAIVHRYVIPTRGAQPWGIAAGADGALWFTEAAGNKIGRVTTAGAFTEFPLPTPHAQPQGIAAGPDGSIWFVESRAGKIGRIRL